MKRLALALALIALTACGSGGSPSPTAPSATLTRIIGVSGSLAFGNVTLGSSANATFTITNTGTGPLTVTSLSASTVVQPTLQASWTSGSIAAGGSQVVTVTFTPAGALSYTGTITVNGDQTGGSNTLSVTGTGISSTPTPPPTPTNLSLTGTITDGTSHGVLPGINVQIASGTNSGRSTTTDASGNYTLGGLTGGTFSVSASGTGYQTTSQSVTMSSNARLDIVLPRGSSPAPTPTPSPSGAAVQYSITGTARRCSATYQNSSGGTNQSEVSIPFTYSWPSASRNDFMYMSCQIDTGGDNGSITITLFKNGVAIQTATANGFPNIATVSGLY